MRNRRVLVGRSEELAAVAEAVAAARGGDSQLCVIKGEPGIGKTALLDAAIGESEGMRVVRTAGIESESDLTMAGLFELVRQLEPYLAELEPEHAGPLSEAVAPDTDRCSVDRFTLGVALLRLLAAAADRQPLIVAVDDAHWLDQPSRDALLFAARRMDAECLAVLITVRAGEDEETFRDLPAIELGPLAPDDAIRLLARSTPRRLAPAIERRVLELSAGNPLALVELPLLIDDTPTDGPVLVFGRLQDAFGHRLRSLANETRQALHVAGCSFDQSLAPVLAALRRLSIAPEALSAAEDAGFVSIESDRLVFRHPLVRAAAFTDATPSKRRSIHAAFAEVLDGEHDLEHRARHLAAAATGPNELAASLLQRAADEAMPRGAFASASVSYERAADLTAAQDLRARRYLQAAEAAGPAGDVSRAATLIERALDDATTAVTRARSWHARCRLASFGSPLTPDDLARVIQEADMVDLDDPLLALSMRIDAGLVSRAWFGQVGISRAVAADIAARVSEIAPDLSAAATALLVMNDDVDLPGEFDVSARDELADRLSASDLVHLFANAALARGFAEDNVGAGQIARWLIGRVRRQGAVGSLPFPLCIAANASFLTGDWHDAHLAATEAAELSRLTGESTMAMFAEMVQTLVAAGRGWQDDCRDRAASVLAIAEATGASGVRLTATWALGLLELGVGNVQAAAERLESCAAIGDGEIPNKPAVAKWQPDLIEALVELGRLDSAERNIEQLEALAAQAPAHYAAHAAARGRAMLAIPDDIDRAFAAAIQPFVASGDRFEVARTEFAWGSRLLALGRANDAKAHLQRSLCDFDSLEAEGWAARARARLGEAGAELAQPAVHLSRILTARQLRIALAAVRGSSPADIASRLFLTPSTVRRELERAGQAIGAPDVAALVTIVREAGFDAPDAEEHLQASITLLGRFRLRVENRVVDGLGRLPELAVKAVVAADGEMSVDELVETLWPDETEGTGRSRLRNILWRLRDVAGPVLERDGDRVRVCAAVQVDAFRFDSDARLAIDLHHAGDDRAATVAASAIARYRGPFLADEPYELWATSARERFRRRYLELLEILASEAASRGELGDAVRLLDRAIEADPYDEERYVRAARLVREQGRVGVALAYLARAEAVAVDLAIPLSSALQSLRAELLTVTSST